MSNTKKIILIVMGGLFLISACAPATAPTEPPAVSDEEFLLPESLKGDWAMTTDDITTWWISDDNGPFQKRFNDATGWVSFDYDGYSIRAKLTTNPNPSKYDGFFETEFDVQKVDSKGYVIEHARCWDVQAANWRLTHNSNNQLIKDLEVLPDYRPWVSSREQTVLEYGCQFKDGVDVLFVRHVHNVLTNSE